MNLAYYSKTSGMGGTLKHQPEDFVVEEIEEDGTVFEIDKKIERIGEEGKFTHFVLQKRDWSTSDAIRNIGKWLGAGHSRFNFGGNKDKRAVSTQLVSVFGVEPEKILAIKLKDIRINGAWKAKNKVELGQLLGNRFHIRMTGGSADAKKVKKTETELNGLFPNYFGEQRFGSTRKNTARVGEHLVRGELEAAVMTYLTDSEGEENADAKTARKELAASGDFKAALKYFPVHLRLERSMIAHLTAKPTDFKGTLDTLPRNILLLFVHALQSEIFNEMVSARVEEKDFKPQEGEFICGKNNFGFPDLEKKETRPKAGFLAAKIIGYETIELNEHEFAILERRRLKPSDFRVRTIQEIGSKGTHRVMLAPYNDFSYNEEVFNFSIPSGSYATVLMREFLDEK